MFRIGRSFRQLPLLLAVICWSLSSPIASAAQPTTGALRITQDDTNVSVFAGEGLLLKYRFAGVPYKPYVIQWYTPSGINILRDSPQDHKHHHGLMFAVGVDGVSSWTEDAQSARQQHEGFDGVKTAIHGGVGKATFIENLDWIGPDDAALLREHRTIEVRHGAGQEASLITWRCRLAPAAGKDSVSLTGSHYYGLGMRFVESMDSGGRFLTPDGQQGEVVRGQERLVRAKWCAYTASVDGKLVTVALFDHPDNPRHPARMFTMPKPFAYLSATLNLWKEPLKVKADKPLDLCYGIALWDGQVESAEIEKLYEQWKAACSE